MIEFTTATDGSKFVRVFTQTKDTKTKLEGNWLANSEDIKNLTPLQIKDKYALPHVPTHKVEVVIPKNVPIRTGTASKNDFGTGGNRQFEIMKKIGKEEARWFKTIKSINE